MKTKIVRSLAVGLFLTSYAFANEGINCKTTVSYNCGTPSYKANPSCPGNANAGVFTNGGNMMTDQCVIIFGASGSNGCNNQAMVWCEQSWISVDCAGNVSASGTTKTLITPTEANGECS